PRHPAWLEGDRREPRGAAQEGGRDGRRVREHLVDHALRRAPKISRRAALPRRRQDHAHLVRLGATGRRDDLPGARDRGALWPRELRPSRRLARGGVWGGRARSGSPTRRLALASSVPGETRARSTSWSTPGSIAIKTSVSPPWRPSYRRTSAPTRALPSRAAAAPSPSTW